MRSHLLAADEEDDDYAIPRYEKRNYWGRLRCSIKINVDGQWESGRFIAEVS